ncbi:MAG: leucine-rich repeat protein, partial [Bacteroidaceae bacterium]|nr:leucine-rich repeat protein [Bacteroidaceae bacterium]
MSIFEVNAEKDHIDMKKHLVFILSAIQTLTAVAGHITRDEALALAQDFMQGKVMVPVQTSSSKAPVRGGANNESYYIFNAADNGGYAIIAADDRISPVLGFSDQGNINLDNMPENMASWLEYYEYEINSLRNDADIIIDAPVSRSEIKSLLNDRWHQKSPYNLLCPVYDGIQCPVGCVALAMAQIMYYHKWPVGVVDSIPPYINMDNSQLVEGLPATTFKWDLMKPSYNSYEADESAYAVAEFLRYCGQAVEMGYRTDASGTFPEAVCNALIERFNYSRQTEMINKWDYSSYDWDELIYNELASGRPVFYSGVSTIYRHSFVCDGYKDGYFHINWGNDRGFYDGYFKLSLLNMAGTDLYDQNDLGCNQHAIIGIEPKVNSPAGKSFKDENFSYTVLSDTSVMIKAIDSKNFYEIDILWIPDYVDYDGSRYYVTRLGESKDLNYDFKKVCLPSSLKQIDAEASFLQTIKEFTIPSSIEVLSSTAFFYNKSLEKFIAENGYTRYKVIDGVLFSHDGKELMCYPQGRKDTSYTVPDGVETIGGYAFYNNSYLSEIILPDCVEHINDLAFTKCTNLKKISLPDNLKVIGGCAFDSCFDLSNVILPKKIGAIYETAFRCCTSLKSVIISNSFDYCLPNSAFTDCSSLETVYIPSGIKRIGSDCFKGCTVLKEITVESIVPPLFESYSVFDETVYENAVLKVPAGKIDLFRNAGIWSRFKHISAIPLYTINGINYILNESAKTAVASPGQEPYSGDVVIPATIEYNGIEYSVNALQPAAFANCKNLTSVVIDAPVSVLPDSLFKDCSSLKSVKLNDGIVKIGDDVFNGCTALEAIDIPQGVESLGKSSFAGCKSLRTITIPERVKELGAFAFMDCSNLDSVIILGNIKKIDIQTFCYCTHLTYVSLPQSLSYIGEATFYECFNLQTIKIPNNVKIIEKYAFMECSSLTSIVVPENVTAIGDYAFMKCSSLTSIVVPENVTAIGDYAFCDCSSLTSMVVPENTTVIGDYAFFNCSSLTSIVVPENVTAIGDYAFCDCSSLTSIVLPKKLNTIGGTAFCNCQSLKSVILPDGITFIGDNAFTRCSNLDSIVIPQGMEKIERSAFDLCINLKSVILPESITELDTYAFIECYSLTTITIPANVRKIGKMAFEDCRSMTSFYCCVEDPQEIELGEDVFNRINEDCILYVP